MSAANVVRHHARGAVRVRNSANGTWSETRTEGVTLEFSDLHPAAVTMVVDDVPWVFDRTLLEDVVRDMSQPAPIGGIGDVRVGREGMSRVRVWINSGGCEATVEVAAAFVAAFVEAVIAVSPDQESLYDVDGWLSDLLGEGAEG